MLVRFIIFVVTLVSLGIRGSAFPATLAFQIRELERETKGDLKLDAIVTVVDAENFVGYEDTSPTVGFVAVFLKIRLICARIRPKCRPVIPT